MNSVDTKIEAKAVALFLYDSYEESYAAFKSFADINKHMVEQIVPQHPFVQVGALRIHFGYATSHEDFVSKFCSMQCVFIVYNGTNPEVEKVCRYRVRASTRDLNYIKGISND